MRLTRRRLLAGLAVGTAAPSIAAMVPAAAGVSSASRANQTMRFGTSVQGRPLIATCHGDPAARLKVLVVGIIHGNEQAGLSVLRQLSHLSPPAGVACWLVDAVNPDGQHLDTRQNAHGVDLNRNFPTRWKSYGKPHDTYYPGPHAVSEPETKATMALIARLKPTVTIYYHQHLDVIDLSGGSERIEKAYAHRVGMVPEQLTRYGGSACTWADTVYPGTTAFCVELPSRVSTAFALKHAKAVQALGNDLATSTTAATTPTPTPTPNPGSSGAPAAISPTRPTAPDGSPAAP